MNLEAIKNKIAGPVFPIVTPFQENFDVDYDSIKRYIDFLYHGGARIFQVMVHTSRFGLLSNDEMLKVNQTVAHHIKTKYNDCIVIVADPLYKSTQISIDFANQAEADGADLISLIFMERYYFDDQVYKFFESVAKSCNIGILIHEQQLNTIHGATLIPFPLNLLHRIALIPNVISIKEDAKEDDYTTEVVELLQSELAIIVSGGSKEQFMQFAPRGCQAYLVGVGSFFPEIAIKFYQSYLSGFHDFCWQIINTLEKPFFEVSKRLGWHIGLKAAMDYLGIMKSIERPPLLCLDSAGYEKIASTIDKLIKRRDELS
jgi:4-hydroxy-tetrahydrodipicolinate synthase